MEQLAFELVEKYGAAELEKLAKYLELLVFGKKSLESPAAEAKPRAAASKSKATAKAETTPDPSDDESGEPF